MVESNYIRVHHLARYRDLERTQAYSIVMEYGSIDSRDIQVKYSEPMASVLTEYNLPLTTLTDTFVVVYPEEDIVPSA